MNLYYAHSKKIYNTEVEEDEYSKIRKRFPDAHIVCPNRDVGEKGSINPYLQVVKQCDVVVCSEFKKLVGKGVATEVTTAISDKKPVYNLSKDFKEVSGIKLVNNGKDWVEYARLI